MADQEMIQAHHCAPACAADAVSLKRNTGPKLGHQFTYPEGDPIGPGEPGIPSSRRYELDHNKFDFCLRLTNNMARPQPLDACTFPRLKVVIGNCRLTGM